MRTIGITLTLLVFLSGTLQANNQKLTRQQAEQAKAQLVEQWKQDMRDQLRSDYRALVMHHDTISMPIWRYIYGNAPLGERSMFISMHGGGGSPHWLNNQQWDNQKHLYIPPEGLYVAPRAPWDEWNMWFKPGIDELFRNLIHAAVAFDGVNPNRIYLTGYSAGGDGTWRMAPRMADTWAAASMMAGHPGDVSLLNLRNLPFMIWVGELDSAYDRNKLDAQRGVELDELQRADPEGYIHETHVMKGMGHWMLRADTAAIAWMMKHTRNPYPQKIVWRQDNEVLVNDFYWLHISNLELGKGKTVVVNREGNNIFIERSDCRELTFLLCDEMMDLDRPVSVYYQGKLLCKKRVHRTMAHLRETLYSRNDPAYAFPASLTVVMPTQHH